MTALLVSALALFAAQSGPSAKLPGGRPPDEAPARFVIAVGYNAADPDPRPTLAYADDDAARFFLLQLAGARKAWLLTTFDADSARLYPDLAASAAAPTTTELARALGELAWHARREQDRGRTTELVFYFAGHGDVTPSGDGYLVLADGRLTRNELYRQVVRGSPTDLNHLVLDACASYFMVQDRDDQESGARPLTPQILDVLKSEQAVQDPAAWARTGVLVSTSSSAAVHETSALASGVFSYLLRSALSGAGDTDGDGRLHYSEVAAFIAAASRDIGDPRAALHVHAAPPAQRPQALLGDLTSGGAEHFLRISTKGPRRVRILDAQGLPYVEVHQEPEQGATIALIGGPFFIVQTGDQEALLVPRAPGTYALDALTFDDVPTRRREDPAVRALFATAYGRAYLKGFVAGGSLPAPSTGPPFLPPYARGGEPPFRLTAYPFAAGAAVGAVALLAVAGTALAANFYGFWALEQELATTGRVDPALSLVVEGARATAYGAAILGVAAGLTSGGLLLYAALAEESE